MFCCVMLVLCVHYLFPHHSTQFTLSPLHDSMFPLQNVEYEQLHIVWLGYQTNQTCTLHRSYYAETRHPLIEELSVSHQRIYRNYPLPIGLHWHIKTKQNNASIHFISELLSVIKSFYLLINFVVPTHMESSMTDSDDDHPFRHKDSHAFMTETA